MSSNNRRRSLMDFLMNRKVSVSALVAVFVLMSFVGSAVAASGEVLVLHFDEGSGTIARDASGHGNDGTIYGATWVDGISGKALRFDGVDDYADMGNALNLGTSDFTLVAWVKTSSSADYQAIISKRQKTDYDGYRLWLYKECGIGIPAGAINDVDTTSDSRICASTAINDGNWHHIVVTLDRDSVGGIYVDGVLQKSIDITSQSSSVDNSGSFRIGQGSYYNAPYNGLIDEVRIYNRALTADEIRTLYEGNKPELSLTKSASPSTIQEGETTTISLRVENTGTGDANAVEVSDTIPLGFKLISGSKSASFGEIKSGDYRTFEYTLKATGSGKFTCDPATATYTDVDGNSYSCASNSMSLEVGGEIPVGADSDGDGWSDEKEREMGTNPYSVDSDSDGLNDPEDPNPTVPEKEKTPGFEAVVAIAGLVALAYVMRRRRK